MKRWILPAIILSQFFCTSLWFAGNAISGDIIREFQLETGFVSYLTSAVQLGFITGTFLFALLTISDRFSPSAVFCCCAFLAAMVNAAISLPGVGLTGILTGRFFTGFFLAGIYPVGMKIASDYYQQGLGKSLGFLVGALVFGTSFPHFLKAFTHGLPWKYLIYSTSLLSLLGGFTIFLFVPDGPYRKPGQRLQLNTLFSGFRNSDFKAAAIGYFGHMWELYTFWAFLPFLLTAYNTAHPRTGLNVPLYAFLVIAAGGVSCMLGGLLSQYFGAKKIAALALFTSGLCCLVSPVFFSGSSVALLLIFLIFWGMAVTADSPLFSTLVAQAAPQESRGTSLTMVTCIGFAITIVSIQCMAVLSKNIPPRYLLLILSLGPAFGLAGLLYRRKTASPH